MAGSVIVSYARTPIGKFSGGLASFKASDLGGIAIAGALARAGVAPEQVDFVYLGQVILAGAGQLPARQAAVNAGIPLSTPSSIINKVCLSGVNTVYLADQLINAGDAEIVVAGGMESMTNCPYLLPQARAGYRMGHGELLDSMITDGLWCALTDVHMGTSTEKFVGQWAPGITRAAQDAFAAASHQRAAAAQAAGWLAEEIVPIEIPQRKGAPLVVAADEGIRPDTTAESLSALRAAFDPSGTITAGNASQISDGASAMVVMSRAKASELGLTPLAELVSYAQIAGPDTSLLTQPSRAIKKAASRAGLAVSDIDLFELNEAFAAVGLASMEDLGITAEVTNVNGGAIALGHPVGMSGNRILGTLIHELRRRGGGLGAAALCGGGGQGDAAIIRVA